MLICNRLMVVIRRLLERPTKSKRYSRKSKTQTQNSKLNFPRHAISVQHLAEVPGTTLMIWAKPGRLRRNALRPPHGFAQHHHLDAGFSRDAATRDCIRGK